jgi:hypothetical protein
MSITEPQSIIIMRRNSYVLPCIQYFAPLLTLLLCAGCSGNSGQSSSAEPIAVSAASETVRTGDTDLIKATVEGAPASGGKWSVLGDLANGQIDQDGTYHAPDILPQPNTVTLAYVLGNKSFTNTIQILNAIPVISSASPSVLHSLSNKVEINGNRFVKGATVLVNNQPTTTSYIDSSHLSATVVVSGVASSGTTISVSNPAPGASRSASLELTASVAPVSISPNSLNGGDVTLAISGDGFTTDMAVSLDGKNLETTVNSGLSMTATGFLPPWRTGTVLVSIVSKSTSTLLMQQSIPIAPTAVSFDVAARFLMQAGFGPRPDLVEHVQQIGLDTFITEQQAMTPLPVRSPSMGVATIMNNAVLGNTPLRRRVAWALQSFLVRSGIFIQATNFPFEEKMEADSTGNFRDIMTDVSSDVSMGYFLNLIGNAAPRDPSVHPNQNFGRELLQLFTIGSVMLSDDGTVQTNSDGTPIPAYDEDTVLNVSRALTGWVNAPPVNPEFTFYGADYSAALVPNEAEHDQGQKQIFGTILPAGQTAAHDRTMILDAVFAHQNLPPFVSRILIQRLVKSDPSPNYVKRVVAVFKDDGRGVRGNMAAVVRAILLDPEGRSGDTSPSASDGFIQEPYLFETFAMSITGFVGSDDQPAYVPCALLECIYVPSTVFGFFSPSYRIPGTTINSPEFQILNDITVVNRSQILWGIITGQRGGFTKPNNTKWLYQHFKTIPALVDALNHLAYHGQMSADKQTFIINYCSSLGTNDPLLPSESAVFLALNSDSYTVSR